MTIADLLAVGSELEFGGVKYALRKPTLVEQARFSQFLKDKAKSEAGRGDVPDEVREGLYRAAIRDAGELYYEVDSPGYIAALQRPAGFAKLLQIIFETDHPGVTEGTVQAILESGLKEQFVKILSSEELDPKVMEGVLAVLGFPPDYLNLKDSVPSDSEPKDGSPGTSEGSTTINSTPSP